jgi:kynurenine 3-monooxygenase
MSNTPTHPTATIVGCGLAGSLLARLLAQDGWKVRVFERRGDPRAKGYAGGRSINLALSARGLHGLAAAGLDARVLADDAIPMRARMMHAPNGELTRQPYSSNETDAINSVSRGGLNLTLLRAAAELPGVEFHFDHACTDIDTATGEATFRDAAGATRRERSDLLLGADGAFSPVRLAMQKTDRFEYQQTYLGHGYKELHIPSTPELERLGVAMPHRHGAYAMDPNALHIWPRGSSMMIALPNRDGSFTCTLFWPYEGPHGFADLSGDDAVRAFFERWYGDATGLMPSLTEDYARNPVGSLVTVRCFPWVMGDRIAILGDASHAIVPFYGQGMNAAFEDCRTLVECLREHRHDRRAALQAYQAQRKPNADAIADMALENFTEMRDKVGDAAFLHKKKIEQALHVIDPERLTPQYNLVSFSTVPYAEAKAQGRRLDGLYERLMKRVPREAASLPREQWLAKVRDALEADRASAGAAVLHDLSPAITGATKVWPGDTPMSREVLCDLEQGANITLSTLRTTVHLGSHADGPNHYGKGEAGIGEQPLDRYIGPCRVVRAKVTRGARVRPEDIEGGVEGIDCPRVLIRTGTFPDHASWNEDFAGLSVELVEALASRGVKTVGVDTPSVDLQHSKDLPAHHALLKHGIVILEGLVLAGVEPGRYTLMAQPLKLMGFDASPVRAVLAE